MKFNLEKERKLKISIVLIVILILLSGFFVLKYIDLNNKFSEYKYNTNESFYRIQEIYKEDFKYIEEKYITCYKDNVELVKIIKELNNTTI